MCWDGVSAATPGLARGSDAAAARPKVTRRLGAVQRRRRRHTCCRPPPPRPGSLLQKRHSCPPCSVWVALPCRRRGRGCTTLAGRPPTLGCSPPPCCLWPTSRGCRATPAPHKHHPVRSDGSSAAWDRPHSMPLDQVTLVCKAPTESSGVHHLVRPGVITCVLAAAAASPAGAATWTRPGGRALVFVWAVARSTAGRQRVAASAGVGCQAARGQLGGTARPPLVYRAPHPCACVCM